MNTTICFVFIALICSFLWPECEAGDKGDLYILGGSNGCGPGIFYKTNGKKGKKGELIIMNNCDHGEDNDHHYETPTFIPYPIFHGGYHGKR